jgi:hypothetical protein
MFKLLYQEKRHQKDAVYFAYFTAKPASSLSPTRDATKSYTLHLIRDPTVFTEHAVESPLHALFECEGNDDLAASRQAFMSVVTSEVPQSEHWHAGDPLGLLHELLTRKAVLPRFAKFAYEVAEIYNAHPMRLP